MRRFRRTSLRLSLQFAFLYSVLSVVIFVCAYWFSDYEVRDWLHDQMVSDTSILTRIYKEEGIEALSTNINVLTAVSFENARIFQLRADDGRILAGNINHIEADIIDGYVSTDKLEITGKDADEISGYWITQTNLGSYTLVQGTGNHVISEVLEVLGISLVSGFILIVAFGSFVGIWVGRLTEIRIQAISATMERVAAGEISARISTESQSNDDFSRVSNEINKTLEQLENLMDSQVQISSDIAHDLRTPLQRLRQRLEKMSKQSPIDPDDVNLALEQTEVLIGTFNALLRIAQLEAGDRRERFQPTDLCALATNIFEAFEPSAEEARRNLFLKTPVQPVVVWGDPDLLMQLVSNMVENSLRHTPERTTIEIEVSQRDEIPVLSVSDNGPGVAREDREKVFQRFYRGEKSRTSGGNGLGLNLCKAIAELHHANLALSDNQPGLRMETRFPSHLNMSSARPGIIRP